jgi:hypothetical protein
MFLDDPFRSDWYNLTFLVQLAYHDSQIVVHRAKSGVSKPERPPDISPDTLATYDHVFEYRAGYFRELLSPWNPGPMPAVVLEEGRPQIFHQGWALVNREHPATAGEDVIVKAVDLGGTIPPLAPGETFPHDPLAKVIKDIRARFNGVPTTISTKVGWPGEKNLYRLDIRIPDNTVPGLSWLDLGVDGITGPAVEFAVR